MLEIGAAIAQVVTTTLAAAAIGAWALGSWFAFPHPALRWAAQTAAGVIILSHAVFALVLSGLAGATSLRILFALFAVIALARFGPWAWRLAARRGAGDDARGRTTVTWPAWPRWPVVAAAAYGSWMILCATLPPTAPDELIHHLAVARQLLDEPGVRFVDNIYAYFPALGEMLFLFGLAVGGEVGARLFHAALGLCAAVALFGFSRRHLPGPASWWAVAIFLSVPSVMVILPWAYVDLIFTLYALLAFVVLLEFFDTRLLRWAALSGVMAGGALATKYTGLPLILLLALIVLVEHACRRRTELPGAVVVVAGVALAVAAPYVWRTWHLTGWPLFPFAFGPLPLQPGINWDPEREALFLTMLSSYGGSAVAAGPASLWDAVTAPVLVFLNARFNDARWYDGVVGPVFLLAPLALLRPNGGARFALPALFALLFVLYWGLTIRQVRFLIPALPLLAFLVAVGLHRWRSRVAGAVVAACLIASAAVAVNRVLALQPLPFWTGLESRDAYLGRQFAGYAIYQAANRRLGPDDRLYLLNMQTYGYYLRPQWRADFVFWSWRLDQVLAANATTRDVARFFEAQAVTHVMIDERITAAAFTPQQSALLERFLNDRATLLERIDRRALYRIGDDRAAPPVRSLALRARWASAR